MSQPGKWREDQILIICPGSQTTLAQLGCGELTPPAYRFPTRMFKDEESDDWRPYHTFKRRKGGDAAAANGSAHTSEGKEEDEWEYVEDTDSTEGAVYPIQGGRITNMEAFLAFLDHVHSMLTTTYHNTPIMLMASPQWTRPDAEAIARYVFEKTKTPSLCLIHSAVATQYGLKVPNMTVVDVGFEKVDVTCIYDSRVVNHRDVGGIYDAEDGISGGEVFTQRLLKLLEKQGFDRDMAEQLKKSNICEVLPYTAEREVLMELPASEVIKAVDVLDDDDINGPRGVEDEGVLDVANIVASGNTREFLAKREKEKAAEKAKAGRKGKDKDADASKPIRLPNSKRLRNVFHYEEFVTEEVLPPAPAPAEAPKEPVAEVATEAAAPAAATAAAAAEPGTTTEAKDMEMGDAPNPEAAAAPAPAAESAAPSDATAAAADGDAPKPEAAAAATETTAGDGVPKAEDAKDAPPPVAAAEPAAPAVDAPPAAAAEPSEAPAPAAAPTAEPGPPEMRTKRVRRDVEVGLERFTFAERKEIDRIVSTIYRTVQGVDDMYMRPQCWDNIVFVGNGSRVRGLKDNIMQTLQARHLVHPSTATMFTSELPSNMATPSGTGAQTPTGSFSGAPHQLPTSSNVNPLLQAATTANLAVPGAVGTPGGPTGPASSVGDTGGQQTSHHFHSQTPTSIRLAQLPSYLSEWNKNGFEEAMFLGSQVAARIAFCLHNNDVQVLEAQRLMSLGRVDYNELGPKGIRTHSMLG